MTSLSERLRGMAEKATALLWRLTSGRPMRRGSCAFVDVVSGQPVYYHTDRLGRRWLAEMGFGLFRVRAAEAPKGHALPGQEYTQTSEHHLTKPNKDEADD